MSKYSRVTGWASKSKDTNYVFAVVTFVVPLFVPSGEYKFYCHGSIIFILKSVCFLLLQFRTQCCQAVGSFTNTDLFRTRSLIILLRLFSCVTKGSNKIDNLRSGKNLSNCTTRLQNNSPKLISLGSTDLGESLRGGKKFP